MIKWIVLLFLILLIPTVQALSLINPEVECCEMRVIELQVRGVTEFNCDEYLASPAGKECLEDVRLSNEAISVQVNAALLTVAIYYIVVVMIALLLFILLMDFIRKRKDVPIRERKVNMAIWVLFLIVLAYLILIMFPA